MEDFCFGNVFGTINNVYTTLPGNIAVTFNFGFFLLLFSVFNLYPYLTFFETERSSAFKENSSYFPPLSSGFITITGVLQRHMAFCRYF